MPFLFSFKLQDVEQSPRMMVVAIAVLIASALLVVPVLRNNLELKYNKIHFVVLIILLLNLYSFSRSINPGDGLFEFLKIILFYSLFFILSLILSGDAKNKLILFKCMGISVFIFLAYALLQQQTEIENYLHKNIPFIINYDISSTLGNKNFFAETLLLMLPFTLLSIFYHTSAWRILYFISSLCIIITIAILQTLSTWVALFIAAVALAGMIVRFRKNIFTTPQSIRKFKFAAAAMILFTLLSGFVFVQIAGTGQIKSRVKTFHYVFDNTNIHPDSLTENSAYERISLWKNALKITGNHPVTGAGLGNWKIISPAYGIGTAEYMSTGVIRFIHPHNDFLLISAESGIPVLVAFLFLLGFIFYYGWKIAVKPGDLKNLLTGLTLITAVTMYAVIAFVSMPSNRIYPFLLLMIIAAIAVSEYNKINSTADKPAHKKFTIGLLIITIISGLTAVYTGSKRIPADFHLSEALLFERENNFEVMQRHLAKIDTWYFPIDATATPVKWYHGFSYFYTGDQQKAFSLFKEAEKVNPNHLMVLNDLGTCYNLSGDPQTAMRYYKKALGMQPAFSDALVNLSVLYYNQGKQHQAYQTLKDFRGKVMPKSVQIFTAVFMAEAATLTNDTTKLNKLQLRLNHPDPIMILLKELRANNKDLKAVL